MNQNPSVWAAAPTHISLHSRDDHGVGHLRLPVDEPVRLGQDLVDRRAVQQLVVVRFRVGEARLGGEILGDVAAEPHRLVPDPAIVQLRGIVAKSVGARFRPDLEGISLHPPQLYNVCSC